jgi:hypothetical protein
MGVPNVLEIAEALAFKLSYWLGQSYSGSVIRSPPVTAFERAETVSESTSRVGPIAKAVE